LGSKFRSNQVDLSLLQNVILVAAFGRHKVKNIADLAAAMIGRKIWRW
jgi:hypothetical protein